jgi:hypothetical protein
MSIALDIFVILSILLNIYSLYLSYKTDSALNKMDSMMNLMNSTLQKNSAELDAHVRSTYPDILAAHMKATNDNNTDILGNESCEMP